MLVDIGLKADLFYLALFLMLLCLAFFLFLVIFEFTEVDDPANRRNCLRGHLHQIQFMLIRQI